MSYPARAEGLGKYAKEPNVSHYLAIVEEREREGGRLIDAFPKAPQSETQTTSSSIWSRVIDSISKDCYIKRAFLVLP